TCAIPIYKNIKKSPIGKLTDVLRQSFNMTGLVIGKGFDTISKIIGLNNINKALSLLSVGWFGKKSDKKRVSKNYQQVNAFDRSMEYFSDNFPASYGLGLDLSSAL